MSEGLRSILLGPSTLFLGPILGIALILAFSGHGWSEDRRARRQVIKVLLVAVVLQGLHFAEELYTGLHLELPALFGLAPWSLGFFVGFNLFWLAVWLISAFAFDRGNRAALAPIWFLALAAVGNGIIHPLLALRVGGYFPGLVTAPVMGVAGVVVWMRLIRISRA